MGLLFGFNYYLMFITRFSVHYTIPAQVATAENIIYLIKWIIINLGAKIIVWACIIEN